MVDHVRRDANVHPPYGFSAACTAAWTIPGWRWRKPAGAAFVLDPGREGDDRESQVGSLTNPIAEDHDPILVDMTTPSWPKARSGWRSTRASRYRKDG